MYDGGSLRPRKSQTGIALAAAGARRVSNCRNARRVAGRKRNRDVGTEDHKTVEVFEAICLTCVHPD
jgi:hypothetical protein